jgi:hypothetical protein
MVDDEVLKYREALKSPEVNVRRAAARALGEIGPGAKDAVPELIEALNDEDTDLITVCALEQIGPAARAAAPAITQWLKKIDSWSGCRCRRNIRGQLPYLPEDVRRRFGMNMHDDEGQVQASKYG